MSSRAALVCGVVGVIGLTAALLTGCAASSDKRAPPDPSGPAPWPTGTAQHVYRPSTDPLPSSPGPTESASTESPSAVSVPNLAEPRRVAVAAASAVCNFDWRQKLADRIAAVRRYATAPYAQTLAPSASDVANWKRTQADHESGVCAQPSAAVVSTAPNSSTVYFERVRMQQQLRLPNNPTTTQSFEVLYRVEKQYDGRWLVGAEGDGG